MIFLTVGSRYPFDRLVRLVDEWAAINKGVEVFAQIGDSSFQPKNFSYVKYLSVSDFRSRVAGCDFLVSHAGMGGILSASDYKKKIVVYPRLAEYGEVVNDHQMDTLKMVSHLSFVLPAHSKEELFCAVEECLRSPVFTFGGEVAVSESLVVEIKKFINS